MRMREGAALTTEETTIPRRRENSRVNYHACYKVKGGFPMNIKNFN